MNKDIRLAGIAYESLVNGPGMRRVFFAQGCSHNCKDCFNPDTHDFNGGQLMNMDELITDVIDNPMIKGITFSGGDPIEQVDKFAYMAKNFKKANLNIWCYTGYTFEQLIDMSQSNNGILELIKNIDVLVDGKFQCENKVDGLKYKGSSNQRIININETLKNNKIIILESL